MLNGKSCSGVLKLQRATVVIWQRHVMFFSLLQHILYACARPNVHAGMVRYNVRNSVHVLCETLPSRCWMLFSRRDVWIFDPNILLTM